MSESTTTNGTLDLSDAETAAYIQKLIARDAQAEARKAEAKAKRERSNDRPFVAGTDERMNATQAAWTVAGDLLRNWTATYANDPAAFMRRVSESLIPVITNLGNTDSLNMSTAQDGARHTFASFKVPTAVKPTENVPMPGKSGK